MLTHHILTETVNFLRATQAQNIARALRELMLPDFMVGVRRDDKFGTMAPLSQVCTDPLFSRGSYPAMREGEHIGELVNGSFNLHRANSVYEALGYRLATSGARRSRVRLQRDEVMSWAQALSQDYEAGRELELEILISGIFSQSSGRAWGELDDFSFRRAFGPLALRLLKQPSAVATGPAMH